MADFLMRHGNGYKYVRAIPTALQPLVGQKFSTRYIGTVSHEEAKAKALAFANSDQQIMDGLKRLPQAERAEIERAGGLKGWRVAGRLDMFDLALPS